jgi:uncharacterized protein (DUF2225 family)
MCSEEEIQSGLQKKERKLTVSELRKYKGFENISDNDAEIITEGFYQLSLLCYSIYKSKTSNNHDNGS